MKKYLKLTAVIMALVTAFCLCAPITSFALSKSIQSYYEWDILSRKLVLKNSPEATDMRREEMEHHTYTKKATVINSGWYFADGEFEIGSKPVPPFSGGGLGISGDVHIILGKNAKLRVIGGFSNEGKGNLTIHTQGGENASIEIIGYTEEKKLLSNSKNYAEGYGIELESFTVDGGNVKITGSNGFKGAAPFNADGKPGYAGIVDTDVTVNAGNVTVCGGKGGDCGGKKGWFNSKNDGGAGGPAFTGCHVTVNGGSLKAFGGDSGKWDYTGRAALNAEAFKDCGIYFNSGILEASAGSGKDNPRAVDSRPHYNKGNTIVTVKAGGKEQTLPDNPDFTKYDYIKLESTVKPGLTGADVIEGIQQKVENGPVGNAVKVIQSRTGNGIVGKTVNNIIGKVEKGIIKVLEPVKVIAKNIVIIK